MKFKTAAAIAMLSTATPCFAASDLDSIADLLQSEFKSLSKDLGAALSYKPVSPAEPLGLTGFDIGVEVTGTELKAIEAWKIATDDTDIPDTLPIPKLHLIKGLPLNIDVGVVYSSVPSTNIKLLGGELRYAFMGGNTVLPAVAVRASMTKLSGVDELELSTKGLDVSISKGFAMFTPYAGAGMVWVDSNPSASTGLKDESFSQSKFFAGANINLTLLNLALEYDNTDSINSYSLKLGWRF